MILSSQKSDQFDSCILENVIANMIGGKMIKTTVKVNGVLIEWYGVPITGEALPAYRQVDSEEHKS